MECRIREVPSLPVVQHRTKMSLNPGRRVILHLDPEAQSSRVQSSMSVTLFADTGLPTPSSPLLIRLTSVGWAYGLRESRGDEGQGEDSREGDRCRIKSVSTLTYGQVHTDGWVVLQRQISQTVIKPIRRHPWGFVSLLSTIPFLAFISLFSTVICPPLDGSPSSPVSQYVLTPLGVHSAGSLQSPFLQSFCYPSNVYHREVLKPYIYPVIDQVQNSALSHPIYTRALEPGFSVATDTCTRLWEGPLQPIVHRISRGSRRFYLTFVEPHIPYLKKQAYALTAPYTSRLSALHHSYISPHLATAQMYAQSSFDKSVEAYNYASTHPVTTTVGRYGSTGYQFSRRKGYDAYIWSRPHLVRAGQRAEIVAKDVLGPKAISALQWGAEQAVRGWTVLRL